MKNTSQTIESLTKSNEILTVTNQDLQLRLDNLEEYIRLLQRGRFAAKSESLTHPGMKALFEDELDEQSNEPPKETKVEAHTRTINRKPLPANLPRQDVVCDLSEAEKIGPCCQEQMKSSHEKTSEKLHIKPAEFLVKRFITPVYSCKKCDQMKQAKMPAHPLPKCSVTLETLAYLAVDKYIDGMPLHRLEKKFLRGGVELGRDKMSRWLIKLSEKIEPIKDLVHAELLNGGVLGMDETSLQVLKEKGRRADQKSYMLVQAREGPPGRSIVLFHYEKSRAALVLDQYLNGFSGSLVTDGLSSYQTCVGNRVGISHGGCWAHARRKFADAVKGKKNNTGVAKDAILLIKELFEIEKSIKGKGADVIQAARTEKSEPVIKAIESLWTSRIGLIPRKSLSGKALHYLKNQWELLTRFLKDPNLPIHNNFVERQVRPLAVGRRAWLFCDTPAGAQASATFYSLLVTAKENGLDPMDYLIRVFSEIDQCDDLTLLLPFA